MNTLSLLVSFMLAYLLGAFPSAFVIAKLKGINIFDLGSGNMGAMNTARNLGYGFGVLVLLLDVGKGFLAIYASNQIASFTGATNLESTALITAAGIGVIAGHAWSIFVSFKGGKALATAFGTSLMIAPIVGGGLLLCLVLLIMISRRVNLASIITAGLYPVSLLFFTLPQNTNEALLLFVGFCIVAAIIIYKHANPAT